MNYEELENKEDKIEREFDELIQKLTDKEWVEWCLSWYDKSFWVEIYKNWDLDVKENEIDELKYIIEKRKK